MLEKIAHFQNRKDEQLNIELAIELAKSKNKKEIQEIVVGLGNKSEPIANDCIKVLYEIAERDPILIANHVEVFIHLLDSKNNRLIWGSMIALARIASLKPKEIFNSIDDIIRAYEKGSVITVDNSISVFAELSKADKKYEKRIFPLILNHLENCRPKEVPQHSERAFVCVNKANEEQFKKVLLKRRLQLTDPQKKRVDKLLQKLSSNSI